MVRVLKQRTLAMDDETKLESETELNDSEETSEEEETLPLKKTEYDKILEEQENYKKGLLAAKGKPAKKPDPALSGVMTKEDFFKANEKDAFRRLSTISKDDSPELVAVKAEIKDNRDAIVEYFVPRYGRDTVADIEEALLDAHATWKRKQAPPRQDDEKVAAAEIAQSTGKGGSTPPPAQPVRKKLIQKQGGMETWYN